MSEKPDPRPQSTVEDHFPAVDGTPLSREQQWRSVVAQPTVPLLPEVHIEELPLESSQPEGPWPVSVRTALVLLLILVFLLSWQGSASAA